MRVQDNGTSVTLWASANDTYAWAHRSGSAWPCSGLSGKRMCASFDTNGLVDLTVNGQDDGDVDASELNALASDLLSERIDQDHPCWFITIGQFR
jgi:hypothetical protein